MADKYALSLEPRWTSEFVLDLALALEGGESDLSPVLDRHDVTQSELAALTGNKMFGKALRQARTTVEKEGLTFREKARAQAELLLDKSWQMIHDDRAPLAPRVDLIKNTIRWAGLDTQADMAAAGVSVVFNFQSGKEMLSGQTIDAKVVDDDTDQPGVKIVSSNPPRAATATAGVTDGR